MGHKYNKPTLETLILKSTTMFKGNKQAKDVHEDEEGLG